MNHCSSFVEAGQEESLQSACVTDLPSRTSWATDKWGLKDTSARQRDTSVVFSISTQGAESLLYSGMLSWGVVKLILQIKVVIRCRGKVILLLHTNYFFCCPTSLCRAISPERWLHLAISCPGAAAPPGWYWGNKNFIYSAGLPSPYPFVSGC